MYRMSGDACMHALPDHASCEYATECYTTCLKDTASFCMQLKQDAYDLHFHRTYKHAKTVAR